jgi:cob(I)alamin adenosyltransferase
MVYISKVYTRSGDGGQTMLASGETVAKHDQRIRAYGDVDELNATVGWVCIELGRSNMHAQTDPTLVALGTELARIQNELFNLGAELSTADPSKLKMMIEDRHIERLEQDLDKWNAELPPLKSFVLPGGGAVSCACHLARTTCRRAERELSALASQTEVRGHTIRYLNRLGDYLFVIGRSMALKFGHHERLWDPEQT